MGSLFAEGYRWFEHWPRKCLSKATDRLALPELLEYASLLLEPPMGFVFLQSAGSCLVVSLVS